MYQETHGQIEPRLTCTRICLLQDSLGNEATVCLFVILHIYFLQIKSKESHWQIYFINLNLLLKTVL